MFKLDLDAMKFFSRAPQPDGWGGVPWVRSVDLTGSMTLQGCAPGGLQGFLRPGVSPDGIPAQSDWAAILVQSEADVDTDGMVLDPVNAADQAKDPCHQHETSLRGAWGRSLDSYEFNGIVLPPQFRLFGLKLGDLGLVAHDGVIVAGQWYDTGPRAKIGEFSIHLLSVGLGIQKISGRRGHSEKDIVCLMFPGSGNGTAIDPKSQLQIALDRFRSFREATE